MHAFTGGDHPHPVGQRRSTEILVEIAGLEGVLKAGKAGDGGGGVRVMGLIGGVLRGEVGVGCLHVEIVGQHEKLAGPGFPVGLDHWGLVGFLGNRGVVGHELRPGGRHAQPQCLVGRHVVEDAAAHRSLVGHAVMVAVRVRDGLQEAVVDVAVVGQVVQRNQRARRAQRLEQRSAVVAEEVRHFARGEQRLDEVVAFGAFGPDVDRECHFGILRGVGRRQRLEGRLVDGVAVNQHRQFLCRNGPGRKDQPQRRRRHVFGHRVLLPVFIFRSSGRM